MKDGTYSRLLELGFDMQQINQIEKVASNFEDLEEGIDYVLRFVTPSNDINCLREVGSVFKKYDGILEDREITLIMNLLKTNTSPHFFVDNFIGTNNYSRDKSEALALILDDFVRHGDIKKHSFGSYSLIETMDAIKECKARDGLAEVIRKTNDLKRFSPLDVIRKEFNDKQIACALKYCTYGYKDLVDDILKLNRLYDIMGMIFEIKNSELPFVDLVNNYDDSQIAHVIGHIKTGINVLPHLLNKPYKDNIDLCALLLDQFTLTDEEIAICLEKLPYQYHEYEKDTWEVLIRGTVIGIDFTEYFSAVPTKKALELIEFLHLSGYSASEVKSFYNIYQKNKNYFAEIKKEDFVKMMNLHLNGYDISNVIKYYFNQEDIALSFKIAKEYDLDVQYIFDNIKPKQVQLINKLKEYNREDLAIPLLNCKRMNIMSIDKIEDLLISDIKNNERHKVINLLFDKGNDVFNGFDECYEFSEFQKVMLVESIMLKIFDDNSIDQVRDKNIAEEKIKELSLIKYKGYDISGIVSKAAELSSEQIKKLGECLGMGFDLIPREDKEK